MTAPPAEASTKPKAPASRLSPDWFTRSAIALAVALAIAVRVLPEFELLPYMLNDRAVRNLGSFLFGALAVLMTWGWISFLSGYSRTVRLSAFLGLFVGIGLFLAAFRIEGFDGNMVIRLAPRWQPVADRRLGQVAAELPTEAIDLATTTPDDFPEFLGPGRKCWVEDPGLATDWTAQPPKLLWKREIGAGWSAFSAVNGYAVTLEQRGDLESVTCYDIATGKPVWARSMNARHQHPLGGVGPRSTPTIAGGRVYALGATGILQCLEGDTGELVWSQELLEIFGLTQAEAEANVAWGRAASPLVVDDLVIVPAGGKESGPKSLVAFRTADGEKVWDAGSDQIAYSSPAIATLGGKRQIVIVNEKTASGHDPASGKELWSTDWPGDSSANASASQAVPLPGDLLLLSKGYGGGAKLLEFGGSGSEPGERWVNNRVLQTKFTNVTVIDGHIYGLSDGILECVEMETGKRRWKKGRYNHGQILGVGKLVLVVSEDGRVALVEANPDRFVELTSFQAIEGLTWNNPCLYGKLLLVRNGQEAACYELP
jgi:outer membrane protein assembly factor BamB